ncbi:MAG TPA: arsenic resistance N-acetyltransferase ArsN2 [Vicinamibacterales bacterium]|nr:arsenic resistance N-acetyltransferase ArsN2 [Vicinamibacterales bacterium]
MNEAVSIGQATAEDRAAVWRLLEQHRLPLDGLSAHWGTTLVAKRGSRVIGCAALEPYADGALLRSVAVAADEQGRGLGQQLTHAALQLAIQRGMPALYLLTTTAGGFFPKFGFEQISRADVPASVQVSVEFTSACPSSATVMRKRLPPV